MQQLKEHPEATREKICRKLAKQRQRNMDDQEVDAKLKKFMENMDQEAIQKTLPKKYRHYLQEMQGIQSAEDSKEMLKRLEQQFNCP